MTKTKKEAFKNGNEYNSQLLLFGTAKGKQKCIINTPPALEIIRPIN